MAPPGGVCVRNRGMGGAEPGPCDHDPPCGLSLTVHRVELGWSQAGRPAAPTGLVSP